MAEQLPMPLPAMPDGTLVDTAETASARALIARLARQSATGLLFGPQASGKSLLGRWAQTEGLVVIDDVEHSSSEQALFHQLNWHRETRQPLLLLTGRRLGDWPVALPDLSSRLRALPYAEIAPPGETTLALLLGKRFSDLQTRVDASVVQYLATRLERSYAAIDQAVTAINAAAIAQQRPITVPLVKSVWEAAPPPPVCL